MKTFAWPLLGAALASVLSCARAQESQRITITGSARQLAPEVAGFGDLPLSKAPLSATVITLSQLRDAGISGIGDLTLLDAGITDAYNAPGYWGQLAVRGFTLDNRYNFRRDGLPINAETVIAQGNKQAVEVLKGTSGLQAGTSAPGGLVNLLVKRPAGQVRSASLAWEQPGTIEAAVDLGDSAGQDDAFGWRLNASAARLDPMQRDSRGHRALVALATQARLGRDTLLELELESSRQRQPSTPGFSLLGDRLPAASSIDPRLNLNNQAWSLPVVMDGNTASVRLTQTLEPGTELKAHLMQQRLRTDDRVAFPYGFYIDPATYDCGATCDRFAADGRFSYWDYRSEGERRTTDALDVSVNGRSRLAGMAHRVSAGILLSRFTGRVRPQAFNLIADYGSIAGTAQVPPDPTPSSTGTQRDERSTEWRLQDVVALDRDWTLWAGLRHARLHRASVLTDNTEAVAYRQALTTPWLALSRELQGGLLAYGSWGQGVELDAAPNRATYTNAGQPLPALKSRQVEAGIKASQGALSGRAAVFDIRRPVSNDVGACDGSPATCTHRIDGAAKHRGVEAEADWRAGAWSLRGSVSVLHARREDAADPALNGLRPVNVPINSVKLQGAYNVAAVPGLALLGFLVREGERMVLPDNSVSTPGWTRVDLGARYTQQVGSQRWIWRLTVENLSDTRAWKEAPYQYGHAYLYPLPPRTLNASLTADF